MDLSWKVEFRTFNMASSQQTINAEIRIANGQYRLEEKIGTQYRDSVSIYKGTNVLSGEKVTIKLEHVNANTNPQLSREMRECQQMKNCKGIPSVKFYGIESDYYVVVIDLLGPSLKDLFEFCDKTFSLKTILMIAVQMVSYI